jgi:hypothetical protein
VIASRSALLTRQRVADPKVKGDAEEREIRSFHQSLYVIEPHQTEGIKEITQRKRKNITATLALPAFHLPFFLSRHAGASCQQPKPPLRWGTEHRNLTSSVVAHSIQTSIHLIPPFPPPRLRSSAHVTQSYLPPFSIACRPCSCITPRAPLRHPARLDMKEGECKRAV